MCPVVKFLRLVLYLCAVILTVSLPHKAAAQMEQKTYQNKTSEEWAEYIVREVGLISSTTQTEQLNSTYLEIKQYLANVREGSFYNDKLAEIYDKIKDSEDVRLLKIHSILAAFNSGNLESDDFQNDNDWFVQAAGLYLMSRKGINNSYLNYTSTARALRILSNGSEADPGYNVIKGLSFMMQAYAAYYTSDIEKYLKYSNKSGVGSNVLINAAIMHFSRFQDEHALNIIDSVHTQEPEILSQINALNYMRARMLLVLGRQDQTISILESPEFVSPVEDSLSTYPLLAAAYALEGDKRKARKYIKLSKKYVFKKSRATIYVRNTEIFLTIENPTEADKTRFTDSIKASVEAVVASRSGLVEGLNDWNHSSFKDKIYLSKLNEIKMQKMKYKSRTSILVILLAMYTLALLVAFLLLANIRKKFTVSEGARVSYRKKISDIVLTNQLWKRSLQDSFEVHETSISSIEIMRTFDLVKKNINNWANKINQTLSGSVIFPLDIVRDYQEVTDSEFVNILKTQMKTLNAIYDSTIQTNFKRLPSSFTCNLCFLEISLSNIMHECLTISTLNVISVDFSHEMHAGEYNLLVTLKDDHGSLYSLSDVIAQSAQGGACDVNIIPTPDSQDIVLAFPITNVSANLVAINER